MVEIDLSESGEAALTQLREEFGDEAVDLELEAAVSAKIRELWGQREQ